MSTTTPTRAPTADRLAELVIELSGAGTEQARAAVAAAIADHGEEGDKLLAVAQALVVLRSSSPIRPQGPPALTSLR